MTGYFRKLIVLASILDLAHSVGGSEIRKGCILSPERDNPAPEEFWLEPLATGVFTVNIMTPEVYVFLNAGPAEITGEGFVWMQTAQSDSEWEFMVVNTKWQSAQTRVSLTARWKRLGGGGGSGGGGVISRTGVGEAYAQTGELIVMAEPAAVPVGEPARVAAYASDWEGSPAVCDWTVGPAPDAWFVGGSVGVASVQVQRNTPGEAVVSAVYRENPEKTGEATVTFVAVTGITAQPSVVGVGGEVTYGITTDPPGYGWLVTYVPADVSTPGVKTVTAVCGGSSAQCAVTVVGVKRVICEEYNVSSETDDPDEPETVYTAWTNALDEYVELIAVPEPDVPWPEGWPVWEGAEQDAEDHGKARVSRNLATLSVEDADARASCGTSAKAARVIVARLNLEYDNLPEEWAVMPGEPNELVPGGFLKINDNDNAGGANPGEGNGMPDNQDPTPLAHADPDLRPIKLILQPSDLEHGVVTLGVPDEGGPLRAWADGKKNATPKTWDLDEGERPPAAIYLEGYASGVAAVSLSFAHADKLALTDVVNMSVIKVESVVIYKPTVDADAEWEDSSNELPEYWVLFRDQPLKVKAKFTPMLPVPLPFPVQIKLGVLASDNVPAFDAEIELDENFRAGPDGKEAWITISSANLQAVGVLPGDEQDGVEEHCSADLIGGAGSNHNDGDGFDAQEAAAGSVLRVKARDSGDFGGNPPVAMVNPWFIKAAGARFLRVSMLSCNSLPRMVQDQADIFYVSGHGDHANGKILGSIGASDVSPHWNEELGTAVFAGCAVLDINDYNDNYDEPGHSVSPGETWASSGPTHLLGYNWYAPLDDNLGDSNFTRDIVVNYLTGIGDHGVRWLLGNVAKATTADRYNLLGQHNPGQSPWNCCAIEKGGGTGEYWFWDYNNTDPLTGLPAMAKKLQSEW